MNEMTPQQEIEMGTPREDPRNDVTVRPLRWDEDGTVCLGCQRPIRFHRAEDRRPKKIIAVLFGGGLCCSQQCVEVELGVRDAEEQSEEDAAMEWAEGQGSL